MGIVNSIVHFNASVVSWRGVDLEQERLGLSQVSVQGLANGQMPWERETLGNVYVCACCHINIDTIRPPFHSGVMLTLYCKSVQF